MGGGALTTLLEQRQELAKERQRIWSAQRRAVRPVATLDLDARIVALDDQIAKLIRTRYVGRGPD
jgi:hypothetical protein